MPAGVVAQGKMDLVGFTVPVKHVLVLTGDIAQGTGTGDTALGMGTGDIAQRMGTKVQDTALETSMGDIALALG